MTFCDGATVVSTYVTLFVLDEGAEVTEGAIVGVEVGAEGIEVGAEVTEGAIVGALVTEGADVT